MSITTSQMRTQMEEWVKDKVVPDAQVKTINTILGMGDDADEIIIQGVFSKIEASVKDAMAAKVEAKKKETLINEKKLEWVGKCEQEWNALVEPTKRIRTKTFYNAKKEKVDGEWKDVEPAEYNSVKVNYICLSKGKDAVFTKEMVELAIHKMIVERDAWVEAELAPKKTGKKKSSGSKKDAYNADATHHTDEKFTKDIALSQYEGDKGYCFKVDKEAGCVFEEKKKYNKGQRNPVGSGKLEEEMYVVKNKPVIRDISFCDEDDDERCQGAVAFKPLRHASKFAKEQGIIGDIMVQCGERTGDDMFCAKCAKKGDRCKDFFEYKYKKSGKLASSFYTDDNVCSLGA